MHQGVKLYYRPQATKKYIYYIGVPPTLKVGIKVGPLYKVSYVFTKKVALWPVNSYKPCRTRIVRQTTH